MQKNILTALSGLILPLAGYAMPAASSNTYQRSYLAASRQSLTSDVTAPNRLSNSKAIPVTSSTADDLQLVQANPVQELIIIDSAVPEKAVFYKAAKPGTDVIELSADADGLQQLATVLQHYQGLTALHLVSHAEQGALLLGNSRIDAAKLKAELSLFSALNGALTTGADVLLYGCNLAKGDAGAEFLDILQANTHADLAASNNLTGNPAQGGDWQLEIQRGQIDPELAFSQKALKDFSEILAPTTYRSADMDYAYGATSLTKPGDDRIVFSGPDGYITNFPDAGSDGAMTASYRNGSLYYIGARLQVAVNPANTSTFELHQLKLCVDSGNIGTHSVDLTITGYNSDNNSVGSANVTVTTQRCFSEGLEEATTLDLTATFGSNFDLKRFVISYQPPVPGDKYFAFRTATLDDIKGLAATPVVTDGRINIFGASGTGGAYKIGDTISVTWNNTAGGDNNAGITGVTVDFSEFGGGPAVAASNSSETWTASYTITAGAIDATNRNVSITASNADGPTTRADTSNATVDNIAPTVTDARISISGGSGSGGTYIIGDTVTTTWNNTATGDNNSDTISSVTVDFSQFGGGAAVAATNSSGTWTATYTIVAGAIEATTRNVSVTATDNAGNTITSADTSNAAVDNVAPVVANVGVPANGTYVVGQSLDFTVNANGNITVDTTGGTPQIAVVVGATTRQASYLSGSGSSAIVFRYIVVPGDFDANGVAIAGAIDANSGTLTDTAGNNMNLALNNVGSTTSVLVDGLTAPDAPTIGSATSGDSQATVTFTAPVNNGGTAITTYTATASPGGATGSCSGPAACNITVNGLTNGTVYTFTVTATNAKGTSVASAASNAVTPKAAQTITFANPGAQNFGTTPTLTATSDSGLTVTFSSSTTGVCTVTGGGALSFVTAGSCTINADQAGNAAYNAAPQVSQTFSVNAIVPAAPTIGTATAGNTQASVSFTAPANTGGTTITGYTVTSNPGGFTGTGAGSPIVVTGLTNGTPYTFTITATNSAGTGAASAASNSITPSAPQTITFANPGAQNFGTTPTLTATSDSGLTPTFTSSTTGVCTITAGGALTFVTAGTCTINADQAGDSSYLPATQVSRSFTVNPVVPAAPTSPAATAGDTQASVAFVAPMNTGGSAITGYTITTNPADVAPVNGASSPIVVTGLTNGQTYTFTVTANNAAGTGPASAASNSITPAAIQTISFANPGAQNFGTSPTLTATSDSGLTPTFTSSTTAVCTITSGGALTFVTAGSCTINADQAGNASYLPATQVSRTFAVNAVLPGAPIIGSATEGNGQATVSFAAPAFNGGAVISSYTATSSPGNHTASGSSAPITVTGLTNGTTYTFTVTATNSAGSSVASAASNSVTPKPGNSAPTIAGTPDTSVNQGEAYSFVPTASDPDDDVLAFSITNKPVWASFDTTTGALTGTPAKEHVGITSGIVISVSDGEFTASLNAFNLEVINANAAPVAVDDNLTLPFSMSNSYVLNVLANDTDPDEDNLTITAAKASIGLVSIQNNALVFTAPDNFSGSVSFSYSISDGELSDTANVSLTIEGSNPDAPVITAPDDLTVNATGLFTKVNVGVATAVDKAGNRLAVSLVNGLPMFSAGRHELYWRATDATGVSSTVTQLLQITPLVSLSKPKTVINNSTVTVEVILNGQSPVYPVEVPFSVAGTASAAEHDLVAGSVQITSGLRGSLQFNVFADMSTEPEKDIVITLGSSMNLGANASTTVTITEANLAPQITLETTQEGEKRLTVGKAAGVVTISAFVTDPNAGDTVSLHWTADAGLNNVSGDTSQFEFDPAALNAGVYQIALTATDSAATPLSNTSEIYLHVRDVLPVLDNSDSNNNLIPDNVEGLGDANANGIPDYLDPGFDCNAMPEQLIATTRFVAEVEPGVCLRKGATAALSNSGGIQLVTVDMQWLEPDMQATNIGGTFDFILHDLPAAGSSYSLVLPQRQPVPQNAVYRKYTVAQGWTSFVQNERNQIFSASGEPGFCPPPRSGSWQSGLTDGHWCVQLTIEDGGPNDADGMVNGTLVDPGGVAVILNSNSLPVANDDSYSVQWNQVHTLEVLANDTDPDGDTLSINQAAAAFGSVSVSDDGQTLLYTPALDFVGTDTLSYGISDDQNGSASATVTVEVYYNRAPTVTSTTASTDDRTAIEIDVLSTATDPDGDTLTISNASAQHGSVVVTALNTLRYTPLAGFTGTDTVSFVVNDSRGGTVTGEVAVSVTAYEVITVVNKSSGGAVSGWPLLLLASLLGFRMRKKALTVSMLLAAFASFSSNADWSLDLMFGKSTTKQSSADVTAQLPGNTQLLQYDDSDSSWALGVSYHFTSELALQAQYVDLGEASVSIQGDTLSPEQFHQAVSDIGPMLAKGVRSGLSYNLWQHEGWAASVQAGVFIWETETNSTAGNNVIRYKDRDTDAYWGLAASYAIDKHISLQTLFSRYHLEGNKADNIMLGVSYHF